MQNLFDKGPLFLQQGLGRGGRYQEGGVGLDHCDEHLEVGEVDLEGEREILVELLHVLHSDIGSIHQIEDL